MLLKVIKNYLIYSIMNYKNKIFKTFDFTGSKCPLPVLKTRRALSEISVGQTIKVLTDDPLSPIDIKHFCEENGHRLLKSSDEKEKFIFLIEKTESH